MPTITARNSPAAGFTLIELLVVLSIMSLLAAVAMGYMQKRPSALGREQLLTGLQTALTAARTASARSGQPVEVPLATLKEPGLTVDPALGSATDRILVYGDGSSSGGLLRRDGAPFVTLDWLTTDIVDAR